MKSLVFVVLLMFALTNWAQVQPTTDYRTDGGFIVVEESTLSPKHKQIVFVASKDITESCDVSFQTYALMEGFVHSHQSLHFPQGLKRGQVIPLWNGEFTAFLETAWLYFDVSINTANAIYYSRSMIPIGFSEAYKDLEIIDVTENLFNRYEGIVLVHINFDSTEPFTALIDKSTFVLPRSIKVRSNELFEFSSVGVSSAPLALGKHLLTVCQQGMCDSLPFRHR